MRERMERETGFEPATLTLATLGSFINGTNTYLSKTPNLIGLNQFSIILSLLRIGLGDRLGDRLFSSFFRILMYSYVKFTPLKPLFRQDFNILKKLSGPPPY